MRRGDARANTSSCAITWCKGLRAIPGVTCTLPEGAFYVYPKSLHSSARGGLKSASDVAGRLLREAHVATVPGEGFGTREHIRVSYATSKAELDRGLERMRKFFGAVLWAAFGFRQLWHVQYPLIRRKAVPFAGGSCFVMAHDLYEKSLSIVDAAGVRSASLGHAAIFLRFIPITSSKRKSARPG